MAQSPFDILGLPMTFDVDLSLMARRRAELAMMNHPDRFTDPLEQADASEKLAIINDAYRQLSDSAARADLMIRMLGQPGQADEKALPPDLLMQMMEIREELEDAQASQDQPTLDRLKQWAHDQQASYLQQLQANLSQAILQPASERGGTLQQAQRALNGLRYIRRMLDQWPDPTPQAGTQ